MPEELLGAVDSNIVDKCRTLLRMAERGEIRSLVIASITKKEKIFSLLFQNRTKPDRFRIIGELEAMKTRILDELRESGSFI